MFSVVIPNYNGRRFLEQCLASVIRGYEFLLKHPKTKVGNRSKSDFNLSSFEIIVVDNNSTDGSVKFVKSFKRSQVNKLKDGPLIRLIQNKRNLGFAAAVNQGILAAQNEWVVVMNNDLRLEKNWFAVMARAIKEWQKKAKIGALFGKVLDWQGKTIESTGLVYLIKGKAFNRGFGEKAKVAKYNKPEFIFGPSASAAVYLKKALLEVGLFDEDFFAYEEDVDLALRLKGEGYKTLFIPQAVSYHFGQGTSRRMGNFRQRMDAKNWWFIIIKNYPISVLAKHGPQIFVERLRNLSGLLKATPIWRWVPDSLAVYGEVILKLPKMLKKRKPCWFLAKEAKSEWQN